MTELYNWSGFYHALCQHGSNLLINLDEELRTLIHEISVNTDMFWSDGLEERLAIGVASGTLRDGVILALEQWRQNVLNTLDAAFGIELDWASVRIDSTSSLIDKLVEAAASD
jgi:hypothetical protein